MLFARYAYGPNRFGYCGSDAVDELFAGATVAPDDRALRELARSFEGAWPYLELIARANGLPDPLDRRSSRRIGSAAPCSTAYHHG